MSLRGYVPWYTRVLIGVITAPVRVAAFVFHKIDERQARR